MSWNALLRDSMVSSMIEAITEGAEEVVLTWLVMLAWDIRLMRCAVKARDIIGESSSLVIDISTLDIKC